MTLIKVMTREIKIDKNLLFVLLTWATESPYTAKKDRPKMTIVMVKVMNFLINFWQSVKPILGQTMSSGYGARSILRSKVWPLWTKSNLFPLLEHVKKFRILDDIYLGLSSTIKFLATFVSKVIK